MTAGRKRCFDKQQALEQAMRVFWQKGYAGASLMDLTSSMGINKPSMYAAFGNKEQLFIQATQNYIEQYAVVHAQYLQDTDLPIKQRLMNFLNSAVNSQAGSDGPTGCYLSVCVSEVASEDMPAAACAALEQTKLMTEQLLTEAFKEAVSTQQLPTSTNPAGLAQYFVTLLHGTAAMARAGKSKTELQQTIEMAIQVISSSHPK